MRRVPVAIIGGGITGQLVQMQIPTAEIFDWREEASKTRLTRQLGANYLWRPLPGLECREFKVVTHVNGKPATPEAIVEYKQKVGKEGDSINGWGKQFQTEMTGYEFNHLPPPRISWGHRIVSIDRQARTLHFAKGKEPVTYTFLISTIPLYSLLSLLDMAEPPGRLRFRPIYISVMRRPPDAPYPTDVVYVNYLSDPAIRPYRFCDRFGERHYESIVPYESLATRKIIPGKVYAHPSTTDILEMLAGHDIYTFGRFGSWAPDELVHETWDRIAEWKGVAGV